jgi:hypothetical protein
MGTRRSDREACDAPPCCDEKRKSPSYPICFSPAASSTADSFFGEFALYILRG